MSAPADYTIHTGPLPSLTVTLEPGQHVMAAPGALMIRDPSISQSTNIYGNKTRGRGLISALFSGEGLFINEYENCGRNQASISFSDSRVGTIVQMDGDVLDAGVRCVRGAFFAAVGQVNVGLVSGRNLPQALLTGQSKWLQSCENANTGEASTLFLTAPSAPVKKDLEAGQLAVADNDALLAMTKDVKIKLFENTGLKSRFGGGEGRFMTVFEGPGSVWLTATAEKESSFVGGLLERFIPGGR